MICASNHFECASPTTKHVIHQSPHVWTTAYQTTPKDEVVMYPVCWGTQKNHSTLEPDSIDKQFIELRQRGEATGADHVQLHPTKNVINSYPVTQPIPAGHNPIRMVIDYIHYIEVQ